jgi:hypothetical protein
LEANAADGQNEGCLKEFGMEHVRLHFLMGEQLYSSP